MEAQFVCLACGYNMVGYRPAHCPFCGAPQDRFITASECSERFRVVGTPVREGVVQLRSEPALGYEHAAYMVTTEKGDTMIDCPSTFDPRTPLPDRILFTHHHFLGACNIYRSELGARVLLHRADAENELTRGFVFDQLFDRGFTHGGLEAYPIDGHTPGFTFYLFEEILFICDYVFVRDGRVRKFNPFGPREKTQSGGQRLLDLLGSRGVETVCGYDYITGFETWREGVEGLLGM